MNGTKLRSSGHFQILTKVAYSLLRRSLKNSLILKFFFLDSKNANVSQNDQI